MEQKSAWYLACGELPESAARQLESVLNMLPIQVVEREGVVRYYTDFYYYHIFLDWMKGKSFSGPLDRPAWKLVKPGDVAILFCQSSDEEQRKVMRAWKSLFDKLGCIYDIFYLS